MSQSRQLAAIMFTDIVGYTALMGEDEQQAFELLKKNRSIQRPIIEKFNGRWIKEIGDGVLASFSTVSDAVYCAATIQKTCENHPDLNLRIGIHLGEVVFEGDDVFGDGVNIASRLEPLAPVGGILVSESVHKNVLNKQDIDTTFIREEQLKNVRESVKIYSVNVEGVEPIVIAKTQDSITEVSPKDKNKPKKMAFTVAGVMIILLLSYFMYSLYIEGNAHSEAQAVSLDKSIVVLPFTNLSSDPEQEYFSDGMMEEILNHLVKIEDLKVISRTTAMQYKHSTKSLHDITAELNVATALEGSVRKDGNQIRITVQLIEGATDTHIWSETYDRELTNVFQVQSDVAKKIASVLRAEISPGAQKSIEAVPTSDPEAYNLFLMAEQMRFNNDSLAIEIYEEAIQKDPEFATAYAMIGTTKRGYGYSTNPTQAVQVSEPYYEKALELDPDNYQAHIGKGQNYLWYQWDFEAAYREYRFIRNLDPNAFLLPALLLSTGRFDEALENCRRNIETNQLSATANSYYLLSLYFTGNLDKVLEEIPQSLILSEGFRTGRSREFLKLRIAEVYQYMGMHDKSLEVCQGLTGTLDNPEWLAILAINHHHLGRPELVSEMIAKLRSFAEHSSEGAPSFRLAAVYAQLQKNNLAFEWLEKAYADREAEMYWLKVYPPFKPIHNDPRWQEMLDKVGFPK